MIYDKQQYSCRLCHLNNAQLVSRGPKCAKKISPCTITPTPPAGTLNKQDRCMLSYCSHQILTLWYECYSWNRDLSEKAMFFNLLLSSFGKPHFLFLADRSGTRCGLAAAHLLGLKCCAFRDGILYSLVVTSGHLSYCCHLEWVYSFSSDRSHQQGIFDHTTATGYFLYSDHSLWTGGGCV